LASLWDVSEGDDTATRDAAPRPRKKKKKKKAVTSPDAARTETPNAAPNPAPPPGLLAPHRIILAGALMAAVGLALVGTAPSEAGRVLWIAGVLALAFGIHRLGRSGPDDALT
jgi:hypothetical protein